MGTQQQQVAGRSSEQRRLGWIHNNKCISDSAALQHRPRHRSNGQLGHSGSINDHSVNSDKLIKERNPGPIFRSMNTATTAASKHNSTIHLDTFAGSIHLDTGSAAAQTQPQQQTLDTQQQEQQRSGSYAAAGRTHSFARARKNDREPDIPAIIWPQSQQSPARRRLERIIKTPIVSPVVQTYSRLRRFIITLFSFDPYESGERERKRFSVGGEK